MDALVEHRSACPFSGAVGDVPDAATAFDANADLLFPRRRSAVVQYGLNADGVKELRLYHGDREVSFDEPDLFAFAETLVRQSRFKAREATAWGPGYSWSRVGPLLEALTEAGVLQFASDAEPEIFESGVRPSPLTPARCQRPRTWAECAAIMQEITGRPLELGWLELVVPVFRVAHMSLDADGRQVGEANVFPPAMRLDIPTRWRTCLFEGTRHQPDRPMNVEALRGMRTHWDQMMALLLKVRAAYLARCPAAGPALTIGEVERLAVCVLALPTYLLMRADGPVANGALHPALSSLFRVTDGLRMVMHQILFVPIGEPTRDPDEIVTSAEIHAYAERNYSFHSEHGVCAGPPEMVAQFLRVLVDGETPDEGLPDSLPPELEEALAAIQPAMDYGFLGLQVHAAAFSVWPAMAQAYEDIAAAPATDEAELGARFARHLEVFRTATYLGEEALRTHRLEVYDEMFWACARSRGVTVSPTAISDRCAAQVAAGGVTETAIRQVLDARLGTDAPTSTLAATIARFSAAAVSAIQLATEVQAQLNLRLGREAPARPFDGVDLDLHNRLQDTLPRRVPYLIDELRDAFGLDLAVTAQGVVVGPAQPPAHQPHSAAQPSG